MDVEVGEHHASPPPPHCGKCPEWAIWEYDGTSSSMPTSGPGAETATDATRGSRLVITPTDDTVGPKVSALR